MTKYYCLAVLEMGIGLGVTQVTQAYQERRFPGPDVRTGSGVMGWKWDTLRVRHTRYVNAHGRSVAIPRSRLEELAEWRRAYENTRRGGRAQLDLDQRARDEGWQQ